MSSTLPFCSVLIVVKDEPSIAETLTVLKPECEAIGAECIVVDSSEGKLDAIAHEQGWMRWIKYQQPLFSNSTISQQRNLAVASASSNILIFCDAGSLPSTGWLKTMYSALSSEKYQVIGGPLEFFDSNQRILFNRNFSELDGVVEYPTCANMGFTRDAYNLAGGFNENLLVAEDDDFIWKLHKKGINNICIQAAIMRMDWGDRRRQRKRAWRYGKGIVNLLTQNRDLCWKRFKKNPDILLYPLLLCVYPILVSLSIIKPIIISIPILISFLLIARNGISRRSLIDHLDHFIYAAGTLFEVGFLLIQKARTVPIVQYPNEYSAYVHLLNSALNESKNISRFFPKLTSSATLNIILFPLTSLFFKIIGVKLINIHWIIGKWNLHWAKKKWHKKLLFFWFKIWIQSLRFCRIKIVYSVHDLVMHTRIFSNDELAINWLINKADGLVFLNERSVNIVNLNGKHRPLRVIPEGPIKLVTKTSRSEMRNRLEVPEENILLVLIGNLQDYKGVDLLISGARYLPDKISIRVAGICHPTFLVKLEKLIDMEEVKSKDIKLNAGFLSESDYAAYLSAADYFIYPCRNINNSGSLNSALSVEVPVIVPDTEELDWITPDCKIILPKNALGDFDFEKLFSELLLLNQDQYTKLVIGAKAWADNRSWKYNAVSYGSLYKEILNG
jgi:glycosyltransferase involved in cell wall biosynthesis